MLLEERRDELGKVLACLLVARQGQSTIRDLERDYRETEGRNIPFAEFGCHSLLGFIRSINKHVKLEQRGQQWFLYPVVSDKIKHVNDLVCRQKACKKSTAARRRPNRSPCYYPLVPEPKPFVPHSVQQEIAKILIDNPNGVNKAYIAQCLVQSKAVVGSVNVNNVDEYLKSMHQTVITSGNIVRLTQSLRANPATGHRNTQSDIDGFDVITPRDSKVPEPLIPSNNNHEKNYYPAGDEDDDYDELNDFNEEYCEQYYQNDSFRFERPPQPSSTDNNQRPKMTSAEFINRARSQDPQSQSQHNISLQENNDAQDYNHNAQSEPDANRDSRDNHVDADSADDSGIDIISPRLKSRLQELMKKNPDGIWCADLLQAYHDEYKVSLDYTDLGFGSVSVLASKIPSVFRLHRRNNRGDFKLYDATKPLPESANKPEPIADSDEWKYVSDDDGDPFPMEMRSSAETVVVPSDVLTYGESVGQERIPDQPDAHQDLLGMLEVYIAEVFSPSLFWIHLRKKRNKLNLLMKSMHEFYQAEGDKYTIPHFILVKGLNCVCTFEDKWHRAIVKSVKPDGNVMVIFYDFGTTRTYPSDQLRFLHRKYSNLPAQAIVCGLYNVKPVNSTAWTRGVSSEFYNKVQDIPLFAMIVKVDNENNSMLVSLVDTQTSTDLHINDWLVHQGFAETGSMGDTVALEGSYADDQISQTRDAQIVPENVPLISPQSILHDHESTNSSTLRPPPGITKPAQPWDYAALIAENSDSNFNASEPTNATFSNLGNINVNNISYPLLSQPEVFLQFWIQAVELTTAVNKLLANNSSSLDTTVNGLNTASPRPCSPATNMNPFKEPVSKNPFKNYQEGNDADISNIAKKSEESTEVLENNFDHFNVHNSTSLSDTLTNLNGMNPSFCTINEQSSASGITEALQDLTLVNGPESSTSQDVTLTEDSNGKQWHDTNPFKAYVFGNAKSEIESPLRKNLTKPPIPPRKKEIATKTETKVHYTAGPVMYNREKSDESNAVSFEDQHLINQSSHEHNSFNFGETNQSKGFSNPLVSTTDSQRQTSEVDKNFTTSRDFSNDYMPCLTPRITSNTYRPPPPSYVRTEQRYDKKMPISPRFTSPVISQGAKAAIDAVQSVMDIHFPDKLESLVTDVPDNRTTHDKTLGKLNTCEKKTSLSSSTLPDSNLYFHNLASGDKPQKIRLIIPKFLQGEKQNVRQEIGIQDTLHEPKILTESDIKKEEPLSTTKAEPTTLWPMENQDSHSPNSTCVENATSLESSQDTFQTNYINTLPQMPVNERVSANANFGCHAMANNNHMNFSNIESRIYGPFSQPQQAPPPNIAYFRPGFMQPGLNHSYQMYQPGMAQSAPASQGIPLFQTRAHRVDHPPVPQWPSPLFCSPVYPQMPNNIPPFQPHFYRRYTSPKFVLRQATRERCNRAPWISEPTVQTMPKMVSECVNERDNKQSTAMTSSECEELQNSHAVNASDLNPCNLSTQPNGLGSVKDEQNVLENKPQKFVNGKMDWTPKLNGAQTEPVLPTLNHSQKWTNENFMQVPQDEPPSVVNNVFKPVEVRGQTIHIFNILEQGWVCTDEILLTFTSYNNRNTALRILSTMNADINFMEVSRAESPLLFNDLDSTTLRLPRMTNSKRIKGTLHLTPLISLMKMMFMLKIFSEEELHLAISHKPQLANSKLPDLEKLVRSYDSNDEYWAA